MFYAIEVRYPDEFYVPTIDEAREAFKIASKVKQLVFKKLSVKDKDISAPKKK